MVWGAGRAEPPQQKPLWPAGQAGRNPLNKNHSGQAGMAGRPPLPYSIQYFDIYIYIYIYI